MNGKSIWDVIRSRMGMEEEDEPKIHITTKGGWYTDPKKLIRSRKTQELLKKAKPVIMARMNKANADQSSIRR